MVTGPEYMAGLQLTLGERIALVRGRLNETQETFGDRFSVKPLTVNQWEKGRSNPAKEHFEILKTLFREILKEDDEGEVETDTYQRLLPFNQSVKIDFHVSPHGPDRVQLDVSVQRKVI